MAGKLAGRSLSATRPQRLLPLLALCSALVMPGAAVATPARMPAAQTAASATLTVVVAPVEISVQGSPFAAALDGQAVSFGDQVRTGSGGMALLTFFDGSETQLAGDTQVEVSAPSQPGGRGVSIFQAAGTTINYIQRLSSGSTFETGTASAIASVRGTTYVVTVRRLPTADATGPSASAPLGAASSGVAVVPGVESNIEVGNVGPEASAGEDPEAGQPDATQAEEPEPSVEDGATSVSVGFTAAGLGRAAPLAQATTPPSICSPGDAAVCITAVTLLTDADGHVGHVQVQARSPTPAADLTASGDSGAAVGATVARVALAPQVVAELQQASATRRDAQAVREVERHTDDIVKQVAPQVVRLDRESTNRREDDDRRRGNATTAGDPSLSGEQATPSSRGRGQDEPAAPAPGAAVSRGRGDAGRKLEDAGAPGTSIHPESRPAGNVGESGGPRNIVVPRPADPVRPAGGNQGAASGREEIGTSRGTESARESSARGDAVAPPGNSSGSAGRGGKAAESAASSSSASGTRADSGKPGGDSGGGGHGPERDSTGGSGSSAGPSGGRSEDPGGGSGRTGRGRP